MKKCLLFIASFLDEYLVTIAELEKRIGETIPIADYAKQDKPSSSWLIPQGCNKS
jgi:endonuclease G